MNFRKTFIVLTLSFLLSACGFHLQGQMQLAKPLQRVYLQTREPYGDLTRALKDSFKMSHATLTATPAEATARLVILNDSKSQSLMSVNSTTQTRQYTLTVVVFFEITDRNGKIIVPPQQLLESRNITIQSNQILGSSNETNLYYEQMHRLLATAIMNRIASKEITELINQNIYLSR